MSRVALVLLPLILLSAPALAQENGSPAGGWFEKIKALEGRWVDRGQDPASPEDDIAVRYKVTAAGNAVLETVFVGTPHEMVTLYYVESGAPYLTHYCAMGNRPVMKAKDSAIENTIDFECTNAADAPGEAELHMHSLQMTFVDGGHIQNVWTSREGSKLGHTVELHFERLGED
ncbi:MAG: hypothetical protein HY720_15080 [Planctomycetes bacterium]|nr:hypothetical protein [Planctomycetota bacterium]